METAANTGLGIRPDGSAMQLHDLLAMCQTDTGPFICRAVVQTLENDEYPFQELLFDADTVVAHDEFILTVEGRCRNGYLRNKIGLTEFDGVGDQVLKKEFEFGRVGTEGWQRTGMDTCLAFPEVFSQVGQHLFQQPVAVDRHRFLFPADARVVEKVLDEGLHSLRSLGQIVETGMTVFIELVAIILL